MKRVQDKKGLLISVIVPVYNVEPYLRKCLDSILAQTYSDLEILLIDDGSTDGSGEICDRYADRDSRIRVFHTENRGLSAARNLGLDHAHGDYIGFVDSDDWIEPDMYELLVSKAEETGADIVECGVFGEKCKHKRQNIVMSGYEALKALLDEDLSNNVWNKLWKQSCFESVRFPEGSIFEDIATTYKIFKSKKCICSLTNSLYHYEHRPDSLSRQHNMKNLTDYWQAHHERYNALYDNADENAKQRLLYYCSSAAALSWAYADDSTSEERKAYQKVFREMNTFAKQNIPLFGKKNWGVLMRVGILFPHFHNRLSLRTAWLINRLHIYHQIMLRNRLI